MNATRSLGPVVLHSRASSVPGSIIFGLGLAVVTGWLILLTLTLVSAVGRGVGVGAITFVGGLETAMLLPLGAYFTRYGWRRRVLAVDVHEAGFVHTSHEGTKVIPWERVTRVFERVEEVDGLLGKKLQGVFTVETTAGRIVIDHGLPDHVRMASTILREAQQRMLPDVEAKLASGQGVDFGALALSPGGIHVEGKLLPWQYISFVRWERLAFNGSYAVHVPGVAFAAARVPSDQVANPMVFATLLSRYGKLAQPLETIVADLVNVLTCA
jgi:hypothetical protein